MPTFFPFFLLIILCLWQAYYREGVALQCLGRHAEALAAFSSGLAQAGVTKYHTPFIDRKDDNQC
jgi:hypothetical protein